MKLNAISIALIVVSVVVVVALALGLGLGFGLNPNAIKSINKASDTIERTINPLFFESVDYSGSNQVIKFDWSTHVLEGSTSELCELVVFGQNANPEENFDLTVSRTILDLKGIRLRFNADNLSGPVNVAAFTVDSIQNQVPFAPETILFCGNLLASWDDEFDMFVVRIPYPILLPSEDICALFQNQSEVESFITGSQYLKNDTFGLKCAGSRPKENMTVSSLIVKSSPIDLNRIRLVYCDQIEIIMPSKGHEVVLVNVGHIAENSNQLLWFGMNSNTKTQPQAVVVGVKQKNDGLIQVYAKNCVPGSFQVSLFAFKKSENPINKA